MNPEVGQNGQTEKLRD